MHPHRKIVIAVIILIIVIGAVTAILIKPKSTNEPVLTSANPNIQVDVPTPDSVISSPLTITGKAKGTWYSEAVFPVVLVDSNGNVLAGGQARAQSDWTTTDFVPFTATLSFTAPVSTSSESSRGELILQNDNPSGDPSRDQMVEIPVAFK